MTYVKVCKRLIITRELNPVALAIHQEFCTHVVHTYCKQDVTKLEMAILFISLFLSVMQEIQSELLSPEQLTYCHHSMVSGSILYFMKRVRIHIHTWVNTMMCSTLLIVMLVWELIYVLIQSGSCNRKKIVTIAQTAKFHLKNSLWTPISH